MAYIIFDQLTYQRNSCLMKPLKITEVHLVMHIRDSPLGSESSEKTLEF